MVICFRDMTFCHFEKCKKFYECERGYTDNVKKQAEKWMKHPPVCFFVEKPNCYEEE